LRSSAAPTTPATFTGAVLILAGSALGILSVRRLHDINRPHDR